MLDLYTAGRNVYAYVEQVNAMPGQGVTSMFSFGRAAGVIDGELGAMGVDPVYVVPRVWQNAVGLPPKSDKDAHRMLAMKRWPFSDHRFTRAKDDGRADASLILAYGMQHQETCK
jgi:crossover junction endodeoxyribonuclease RuvC